MPKPLHLVVLTVTLLSAACSSGPPVIPPTSSTSTTPQSAATPSAPSTPVALPVVDTALPTDPSLLAVDGTANKIAAATNAFIQAHAAPDSTRHIFNAPWGNECVATVQTILAQAGLPFVGAVSSDGTPSIRVDDFRNALLADTSDWVRIDLSSPSVQAAPGDVWVQGDGYPGDNNGQNHVGICQDWSCAHVVSNSSQRGSFTWSDTADGYAEYYYSQGLPYLPGAVYHHR